MMDWIQDNFWLYMLTLMGVGCACIALLIGIGLLIWYLSRRQKS